MHFFSQSGVNDVCVCGGTNSDMILNRTGKLFLIKANSHIRMTIIDLYIFINVISDNSVNILICILN